MTDNQIIQLAESFDVGIRSSVRTNKISDDGETMTFKRVKEVHYAGQKIIDLIRFIELGRGDNV